MIHFLHRLFIRLCGTRTLTCWTCGKQHKVSRLIRDYTCTCGSRYWWAKFIQPELIEPPKKPEKPTQHEWSSGGWGDYGSPPGLSDDYS